MVFYTDNCYIILTTELRLCYIAKALNYKCSTNFKTCIISIQVILQYLTHHASSWPTLHWFLKSTEITVFVLVNNSSLITRNIQNSNAYEDSTAPYMPASCLTHLYAVWLQITHFVWALGSYMETSSPGTAYLNICMSFSPNCVVNSSFNNCASK